MILNNGRNAFALLAQNSKRGLKAKDGTISNTTTLSQIISATTYASIVFGDGITPVSVGDYELDNEIDDLTVTLASISAVSSDRSYDNANTPLLFVNTIVTNDTENDISINELGIEIKTTASAPNSNRYLLTRKVLSDTLVLEAGKSYQIKIEIN